MAPHYRTPAAAAIEKEVSCNYGISIHIFILRLVPNADDGEALGDFHTVVNLETTARKVDDTAIGGTLDGFGECLVDVGRAAFRQKRGARLGRKMVPVRVPAESPGRPRGGTGPEGA